MDARQLHAFLGVRRDFSTWIKDRVAAYGFAEGVDYVTHEFGSPDRGNQTGRGGDRRSVEFALTLDMAKELGMVERNDMGRLVRQYFIQCERQAKATSEAVQAAIAGQLQVILPALVSAEIPNRSLMVRRGKTAGQILREHGFHARRLASWFSHRLREMGCAIEGGGKAELGLATAYLFDPDKVAAWMRNGGRVVVERKLAERGGQGVLRLVPRAT